MNPRNNTETLLYRALTEHFAKIGYRYAFEVTLPRTCNARVDIIAYKPDFSEIIAIEVKNRDLNRLLIQILLRQFYADKLYAALPEQYALTFKKRFINILRKYGIGVLSVSGSEVREVLASKKRKIDKDIRSQVIQRIMRREKSCKM